MSETQGDGPMLDRFVIFGGAIVFGLDPGGGR